MNSKMVFHTAALAVAGFMSTGAVWAQAAPAAGANKVGVINVRQAIVTTGEGKVASAELQSQFASRQAELETLNKQINDLRQRLATGGDKLSDDEKTRLTRQGELLARQLQRKNEEYQEDVNAAQGEVIDKIGRKMVDVLERYSRENGYAAVFDTSGQNSPILYFSTQNDVTQDLIKLYDQAYPVKAGATPPPAKPAAKPATPAPKP